MEGHYFEWAPKMMSTWEIVNFHNPANCLHAVGMEIAGESEPIAESFAGHTFQARVIRFTGNSQTLHVLHLIQENNYAGPPVKSPNFFIEPVLAGRRNGGLRVIEVGIWDEPSETVVRAEFVSLLRHSLLAQPWTTEK
jgi:hypothetical protein